ncbi:prephenate dehydratase domain-containing protein [Serratia marcescens]|uniref:prephenate dehydratase domain-containing protein n=1 Tax=Serratia marcescens TaxID=615 RepID=UPI0040364535
MITVHTLGPAGTNCEKAAHLWLKNNGHRGEVKLHQTLEDAAKYMNDTGGTDILLGCIVYPQLHHLVFENLSHLKLIDCFVMDTHNMVFASKGQKPGEIRTVGSHPAPQDLIRQVPGINTQLSIRLFNSNSEAARQCAANAVDACISTDISANRCGLTVLANFGPVPMGFSIHAKIA